MGGGEGEGDGRGGGVGRPALRAIRIAGCAIGVVVAAAAQLLFILIYIFVFIWPGLGDPVRTTLQRVEIEITDVVSGQPVGGAEVSLKWDNDATEPPGRHLWAWFSSVTDDQGTAEIGVKYTVLDRTKWSKPPSSRDWVSGNRHFVHVRKDREAEEVDLAMQPGATVQGERFTARVVERSEGVL